MSSTASSRSRAPRRCATAGELAPKEGIFVGITAGATFAGALRVAAEAPKDANILCMLPDTGERYLSTPLFANVPADMTPGGAGDLALDAERAVRRRERGLVRFLELEGRAGRMMIEEPAGRIDYEETGDGPTIVFVPGSCSTGAAWRPVMPALGGRFRYVTTSLLGYGGTAERRTAPTRPSPTRPTSSKRSSAAGAPVHLVGHSFGGLVALAVALRAKVPLASLTIAEAPAVGIAARTGEDQHYRPSAT